MPRFLFTLAVLLMAMRPSLAAEPPRVVASIKPIHSLVASIMKDVGEPVLLIAGEADPHDFTLKPSQAKLLQDAQLIFWVGPSMEEFLTGTIDSVGSEAVSIPLDEDHDEPDHKEHDGHDHNPHIWLDPVETREMATKIAAALAKADPANAERYDINVKALLTRIEGLSTNVESALANAKKSGFLVWHNAYEHFEERYGLTSAGSITTNEDIQPGVARMRELRALITSGKVTCIVSEPHANQQLIRTLVEDSSAMIVNVDPSGSTLEAGPDLYFSLIEGVANGFRDCLSN